MSVALSHATRLHTLWGISHSTHFRHWRTQCASPSEYITIRGPPTSVLVLRSNEDTFWMTRLEIYTIWRAAHMKSPGWVMSSLSRGPKFRRTRSAMLPSPHLDIMYTATGTSSTRTSCNARTTLNDPDLTKQQTVKPYALIFRVS